jgi:hypothetical protein
LTVWCSRRLAKCLCFAKAFLLSLQAVDLACLACGIITDVLCLSGVRQRN